jgi:predicted NUDIX family NTP pyrophosphohydrolase
MTKRNAKHSCGILLYSVANDGGISVFLCQANGPRFWEKPENSPWGFPKGGREKKESLLQTAKREFLEEIGTEAPDISYEDKIEYITHYGKKITIFVGDATGVEPEFGDSAIMTREWPPRSGKSISYPEIRDAQWVPLKEARKKVMRSQLPLLKQFISLLRDRELIAA